MEKDSLKTIKDLQNFNFYIPNYQRGYRWGKREVNALLQDILDFYETETNQADFYCLQPIVVKKYSKGYKVIDGQQRLTTIFLIIKFLAEEDIFDISYQTRINSNDFLKNIQHKLDLKEEIENIDYFYFLNTYEEIKIFFNKNISKKEFLNTLFYRCKVLWYEISEQEKENEVFIRLNIGKIPLLEAENIKALFLAENEDIEEDELKDRAEAWYEAEIKARERNDFRYCVLNKINEKNLMYNELGKPVIKDDILRVESYLKAIVPNKNILFDYFYEAYKNKKINEKWEEFIRSVKTLEGFSFEGIEKIDREIFHYIGYLILSGENIFDIYQFWLKNKDKNKFKDTLFNRIKSKVSNYIQNIEELHYGKKDRDKIINILLLFNLEYLISQEDSNDYFKFNRFQLEQWSLEHIYAQDSGSIKNEIKKSNNEEIKKWLIEVKEYIDNKEEVYQNIETALNNNEFNEDLFNAINESFINDPLLNSIQNLTLLDKSSNSRIGNHIFSRKRKEIQKLGEEDKLIPIATKKVFNKEFSNSKDNPDVFTKKDQEDYLEKIKEYLSKYI